MADNHMDVDDVADNLVVEFVGGEDEEDPLEKAKKEFEELWKPAFIIFSKDKNKGGIKSDETYKGIVNAIKKKARGEEFTRNEKQEYNWSDRYTRERVDGKKQILRNGKIVLSHSKLFKVLYSKHLELGHAGRDVMFQRLKDYDSISKDLLTVFVKCCQKCQLKKGKTKKGITVLPILSKAHNVRCQMDLIDFQAKPDGDYNFVLNYQDHFTKYCLLRPLKRKTAEANDCKFT